MIREKITAENLESSLEMIRNHTRDVIVRKGDGTMASIHEVAGVLQEEFVEFGDAVRGNDNNARLHELLDIATATHFAIACIIQGSLEW